MISTMNLAVSPTVASSVGVDSQDYSRENLKIKVLVRITERAKEVAAIKRPVINDLPSPL
jgi:hypothetical protein